MSDHGVSGISSKFDRGNCKRSSSMLREFAALSIASLTTIGSLTIVTLLGGCRFVVPDVNEQAELARRGAIGSAAPGWMAASNKGVLSAGRSGFLPESYDSNLSGTSVSSVYSTIDQNDELQRAQDQKVAAAAAKSSTSNGQKDGPLDRIAKACPGTESEVNDAFTTTDTTARLEKYQALTVKCSSSEDLWVWNGKDFLAVSNLTQAARCFDQALSLNPQNAEANKLLAEVRKLQNKAAAEKALPKK